ncbi:MAG: NTP transferase domain-containing protein [Planctomycetota bacterium]|nr:NTP transferase domain-containing protein [Planctomycetota bacterium]
MLGAIVQARMGSTRFPGKTLYRVAGKPLLEYLLERLAHCSGLDAVVVATSTENADTPIADYCMEHGVAVCRGHLTNVAARFAQALDEHRFDAFVRVSADSPLLDQRLVDKAAALFGSGNFDLVTNVQERTFPRGQSVEVVRADVFRSTVKLMREPEDLEHVTRYFYQHATAFRIHNFRSERDYGDMQMSVDTEADMRSFEAIVARMSGPHWEYPLDRLTELVATR